MSTILKEVLAANAAYAKDFGDKAKLPIPPARRFAVLTCMDARIDPAKMAGLAEGDAHVIRNAGGRASDDAIRSLVISHKLLGTQEWFVIHHTDCGMGMFTEDTMRKLLASSLDTAVLDSGSWRDTGKGPGSTEGEFIDWLTFRDAAEAVVSDVRRIRAHPLVPGDVPIFGYVYDVRSGRLQEVPDAMALGAVGKPSRTASRKTSPAPKKTGGPSTKTRSASAKKPAAAKKAGTAATKAAASATKTGGAAKKAGAATKAAASAKKTGGAAKKPGAPAKKAGARSRKKKAA
jgi:carbonic anhydrase